jgi:hypothetical protein
MSSKPKEQMEAVITKGPNGVSVPCYVSPEEPGPGFNNSPLPLIQEETDGMEHENTQLLKEIAEAVKRPDRTERTNVPTWLVLTVIGVLLSLLTFVYTTLQSQGSKTWDKEETQALQIEKINLELARINAERAVERQGEQQLQLLREISQALNARKK